MRKRRAPASRYAREKAIATGRGKYFELECHHYTCLEDQDVWLCWKPGRGKYWCERHTKWVKAKAKPKRAPLPQEPLF